MTELIRNPLRDALEHIIKTVGQSRTQTRRLRWIGKRAELALEGRPYVAAEHELPPDGETEYGKLLVRNGRLRAEREALQQRLTVQDQRVDDMGSRLEECITEMFLALEDHAVRSAMTVVGRTRFLELVQAHHAALNPTTEATSDEQ